MFLTKKCSQSGMALWVDWLLVTFYASLQLWLPRPHLFGASDWGAQRERHHSRLIKKKTDSSRTIGISLSLLVDSPQLQVLLCVCLPHRRRLKTKPWRDGHLMLRKSPYLLHWLFRLLHCFCSDKLIQRHTWKKTVWSANPQTVTFGNWPDIRCTYFRVCWNLWYLYIIWEILRLFFI